MPKSPHASRHKGRKVWKRPDARQNVHLETTTAESKSSDRSALGEISTNTPRVVKKQRLKDGMKHDPAATARPNLYLATLKEAGLNTPRSTSQRLLKLLLPPPC